MKKVLRIVGALLIAAVIGGCIYLNSLMPIITGYAAKNLASAVFVSGRDAKEVEALDLKFSFIRFNRNKVDYENKTVTSRFLWGKSTAVYRDGYGVTLLRGATVDELRQHAYPLPAETAPSKPIALGDSATRVRLEPIAKALVDDRTYNGHPFAFMALHKGKVVAERYDKGIGPETKLLSWSMAKSFTSALTGVMAGDGLVDINAPVDIAEWQNDGRKNITLNNLLQMQSGLGWDEDYGARSDVNLMLHREQDMGLYALSKPLAYEPGTRWYYSSGTTNIVMRYLRSRFSSDEVFLDYIRTRLFAPLGIRNAVFEQDMSGTPVGSSYIYVTAADYARFGQMYLDDGCVDSLRVLPQGWVKYTATPTSDSKGRYGAFFWLNQGKDLPDVPEDMFYCNGHDGQRVFIVPSKELVVVVLSYSPKPDRVVDFNALLKDIIDNL